MKKLIIVLILITAFSCGSNKKVITKKAGAIKKVAKKTATKKIVKKPKKKDK